MLVPMTSSLYVPGETAPLDSVIADTLRRCETVDPVFPQDATRTSGVFTEQSFSFYSCAEPADVPPPLSPSTISFVFDQLHSASLHSIHN